MTLPALPLSPSKELRALWARLRKAQEASIRAADARAALPPGSSRAKVTTANARWSSAAEDRDRAFAAYRAALAAEVSP